MTLTKSDVDILKAPFPPEEIEFLRGYAYVREQAVNNRLSEVDPSWNMQITAWEYRDINHVVVMGSMTLCDCTRYGIGEQLNDPAKDRQTGELLPPKTVDCAKGAATDLLKRLARLFHVGLYLTELPSYVKDENTYRQWHAKEVAKTAQNGEIAILDDEAVPTSADYEKEAYAWLKRHNTSIVNMMRDLHLNSGAMPSKDDKEAWSGLLHKYAEFLKSKAIPA